MEEIKIVQLPPDDGAWCWPRYCDLCLQGDRLAATWYIDDDVSAVVCKTCAEEIGIRISLVQAIG